MAAVIQFLQPRSCLGMDFKNGHNEERSGKLCMVPDELVKKIGGRIPDY